ncbi:MAG: TonB-dependent receptor [Fermentimonas sp.]|nr:TonB-dependent receptor [Fermentimonas sp.]
MRLQAIVIRICVIISMLVFLSLSLSAQNNQTVKGKVFDIDTHEPLIGAAVVILESEPLLGGTTNSDGNFLIENVPLGRHDIQVSYMGYKPVLVTELMVTSGKEVVLETGLAQSTTEMDEFVVTANSRKDKPLNSMALISARTFTVEEAGRYAGGINDPARLVSAFAGVSVGNVQNNSIIVRGNAPQGVSWRLEGVEIPTPHHFAGANVTGGGFFTLFSSQMLANSDFFTGAFPAEYGNATAAVFDMKFRNGNRDKHEHSAQIGVLGIDISSEGPISRKNGSSYLFNYRYSTMGLLHDLKILPSDQLFKYQDLSFKFNFPTRKAGTFSLWGIGGIDKSTAPAENDSTLWELDYHRLGMNWDMYMGSVGLSHKIILNEKSYLHSNASFSGSVNDLNSDRLDNELTLQPDMRLKNGSSNASLSSTLNYKFNPNLNMRTGIVAKNIFYDLDLSGTQNYIPETYQSLVKEECKAYSGEAFMQFQYHISPSVTANGGIHSNYFGVNDELTLEPRLGLRWAFLKDQTFSLGYGIHSRSEELRFYLLEVDGKQPNKQLRTSKAHHAVAGYDWRINNFSRFKAEAYYQSLYDFPGMENSSYSLINFKQEYTFNKVLVNNTEGYNYGIDLTYERFMHNNYYYLLTASLYDSKYKGGDNIWHNTRYNGNYVANALFGKEFFFKENNRVLDFNIRLSVSGGERYTPALKDETESQKRIIEDESRAYENQFPAMVYLDFGLNYRINHKKASSLFSVNIKNLAGTPVYEGIDYNLKTGEIQISQSTFILPVLSYKIEF